MTLPDEELVCTARARGHLISQSSGIHGKPFIDSAMQAYSVASGSSHSRRPTPLAFHEWVKYLPFFPPRSLNRYVRRTVDDP